MSVPAFDVEAFLATLTTCPGVYRMLDAEGRPLYIGKAANLKNRVSSYFRGTPAPKQRAMLAKLARIEVTVTRTEGEALLLEHQLVKRHRPRYNICLKDDKSYPYIYVATEHPFPRVTFHRGAHKRPGRYFGPYPSASAVRQTLKLLQRAFPVRQCEDSYYAHRSRPCLQYQIKRCTAPCVGRVDRETYHRDVEDTLRFLEGDGQVVVDDLVRRMEAAAAALDFERAARYRDQIAALREILETQVVAGPGGDLDVIACHIEAGVACVQVAWIRGGRHLGDKAYFPSGSGDHDPARILAAFLGQYYLDKPVPAEILLSHEPEDAELLRAMLSDQAGRQVRWVTAPRGRRRDWLEMTRANAGIALRQRLALRAGQRQRREALQALLGLEALPARIECFDISHLQGQQTVASCVVFDAEGPVKSAYRRFNIEGIAPGDDYAALAQAVRRRFQRLQREGNHLPDLLLIDGGKGQVQAVLPVLEELGVGDLPVVGVAKGPARRDGDEDLYLAWSGRWLHPGEHHPGLLLIRQIRDEAHRFAVGGHRQRRGRAKRTSPLEAIAGLGPRRRQRLLQQFGGLQAIKKASVEALASVEGISPTLARRIYETFHSPET
ncbi:excinuclease ABC subunit C [Methylomarinovum tepidoasis]|uniref:UvrABC system protein C n=1 Tax=Methylomarinovum tepidoasis TaxID=2840183 RepID=A0AAU9CBT4_9GAMM|nr:excinuclease ABC subunit UvrC [Methylomarinovum sp. IN45]BCX89381.1 excinuclease ABC subunit C [Methylomarinovum sp. IN45]